MADSKTATELRGCPFCGGKPEKMTSGDGFTSIGCLNCNPLFGIMVQRMTEAEAIEAWNTRAERTCELRKMSALEQTLNMVEFRSWCVCSECGEITPCEVNYCPNCGARVVA